MKMKGSDTPAYLATLAQLTLARHDNLAPPVVTSAGSGTVMNYVKGSLFIE